MNNLLDLGDAKKMIKKERFVLENAEPNNEIAAGSNKIEEKIINFREVLPIDAIAVSPTEEFDQEPETIRDGPLNDSILTEFKERFQKLSKVQSPEGGKLDTSFENLLDIDDKYLPAIEIAGPSELSSTIFSDDENDLPNVPTFSHQDPLFLTSMVGSTTLGNTVSPHTLRRDASNDSIDEIDILDLLLIKTPTTKVEEELKSIKLNKSNQAGINHVRRNFMF